MPESNLPKENFASLADDDQILFSQSQGGDKSGIIIMAIGVGLTIYWFPKASSPAELAGFAMSGAICFLVGLAAFIDSQIAGSKTVVIRPHRVSIERRGRETSYHFDSIKSFRRFKGNELPVDSKHCKYCFDIEMHNGKHMKFSANSPLTEFVQRVSCIVKPKLAATLAAKKKLKWVSGVTIREDGLKMLVRWGMYAGTRVLRWNEIRRVEIRKDKAIIFIHGKKKHVAEVDCNLCGFYPGFHLFREILETQQTGEQPQAVVEKLLGLSKREPAFEKQRLQYRL